MAYISYLTNEVKKDAKKFNLENDLDNLQSKIVTEQNTRLFDRFLPTPYIRKKMGNNYRLIAFEHLTKTENVIIMLKILSRGSSEYKQFLNTPKKYCDKYKPDDREIEAYIKKAKIDKIIAKPILNENERNFLSAKVPYSQDKDTIILETKEWVDRISSKEFKEYKTKYHELLEDLINKNYEKNKVIATLENNRNIKFLYRYFENINKLLLISPVSRKRKEEDEKKLRDAFKDILEDNNIDEDKILQISQRAYPSYILVDQDIWLNIENNVEGNIALSPEETKIVNHFRYYQEPKMLYPLFINGRPGSGKSTILQYLFADQLLIWFNRNNKFSDLEGPLYLTYNEHLLSEAKNNVDTLFNVNFQHVINSNKKPNKKDLYKHFQTFQSLLLNIINKYTPKQKYLKENYIDFPKFKKLWEDSMQKRPEKVLREITPELAWHIIRSFIKGNSKEKNEYFDTYSYKNELPRDEKTVSDSTFELVYDKVWKSWYKELCKKNNLWDDQDLALEILTENIKLPKFTAIYCDESQDFTRVELEIIYNLSFYTKRKLYPEQVKFVPYAFAGDPFQTINPTGFNWSSLKSSFHEKIIQPFDLNGKIKLELNYIELSYNYRSTKSIVGLANLLQLLHGLLFKLKNIKPQKVWFKNEGIPPIYYKFTHPNIEKLIEEQEELVIIVPSYEGYEDEFARNDQLLSKFAFDKEGKLKRNIFSPARAKGLEFNKVLLYKFGQEVAVGYPELLEPLEEKDNVFFDDKEKFLPYEYFINNLYVALTRAQNQLIIADTEKGKELLWDFASTKYYDNILYKYFEFFTIDEDNWKEYEDAISTIKNGDNDDQILYKNRDDPKKIAKQLERRGKQIKSATDLRDAAKNYKMAKSENNAKRCYALALKFENKFNRAAKMFLELDMKNEALDAFWEDERFSEIVKLGEDKLATEKIPFLKAAEFMLNKDEKAANFLNYINEDENLDGELLQNIRDNGVWSKVLNTLLHYIANYSKKSPKLAEQKLKIVEKLYKDNIIKIKNNDYAVLYFYAGKWQQAVEIWEVINEEETNEYLKAKVELTKYPEKLNYLSKLKKFDEIIELYKKNKNISLPFEYQNIVFELLVTGNDFNEVFYFINKYAENNSFIEIEERYYLTLKNAFNLNNLKFILKTVQELVLFYIKNDEWDIVINFVLNKEHFINKKDKILTNKLRNFKFNYDKFHTIVIYNIALNEKIRNNIKLKKKLSEYLEEVIFKPHIWNKYLDIKTVAMAVENVVRFKLAIEFYESIIKSSEYDKSDIKFAKKRWCKSKDKLITRYKDKNDKKNSRLDLQQKCKERGFELSKISEYPEIILPKLDYDELITTEYGDKTSKNKEKVTKKEYRLKTEIIVSNKSMFELEFIPYKSLLRIKNLIEDEQISLKIKERKITGEVDFEKKKEDNGAQIFYNSAWQIFIRYFDSENNESLAIYYADMNNLLFSFPYN